MSNDDSNMKNHRVVSHKEWRVERGRIAGIAAMAAGTLALAHAIAW